MDSMLSRVGSQGGVAGGMVPRKRSGSVYCSLELLVLELLCGEEGGGVVFSPAGEGVRLMKMAFVWERGVRRGSVDASCGSGWSGLSVRAWARVSRYVARVRRSARGRVGAARFVKSPWEPERRKVRRARER